MSILRSSLDRCAVFGLVGCCVAAAVGSAGAQDDFSAILGKHVESLGGEQALRRVHNLTSSGTLVMPALGVDGTFSLVQAVGKYRLDIDMPGAGQIRQGCDGNTVWEITPQGSRILEGKEKTSAILNNAQIFPVLLWISGGYDGAIRTFGTAKIGDREAARIQFLPNGGFEETRYFDQATGELLKTEMIQQSQGSDVQVELLSSSPKDFDGLKMPTVQQFKVDGSVLYELSTTSILINQNLAADQFALPEEIRKLLN